MNTHKHQLYFDFRMRHEEGRAYLGVNGGDEMSRDFKQGFPSVHPLDLGARVLKRQDGLRWVTEARFFKSLKGEEERQLVNRSVLLLRTHGSTSEQKPEQIIIHLFGVFFCF